MQNGFVERCNGNIRKELLNAYVFTSLTEVREKAEEWRTDYNCSRPHQSLGFVPPGEYLKSKFSIKIKKTDLHFILLSGSILWGAYNSTFINKRLNK